MTKAELEDIKKAVCGLECKELRLRSQRQRLEERLIGQRVEWTDYPGETMTGVVVSFRRLGRLVVVSNSDWYTPPIHRLRFPKG